MFVQLGVCFFGFYLSNLFVGIVFETYVRLKAIKHTGVVGNTSKCYAYHVTYEHASTQCLTHRPSTQTTYHPPICGQQLLSKHDQNWLRYEKHLREFRPVRRPPLTDSKVILTLRKWIVSKPFENIINGT